MEVTPDLRPMIHRAAASHELRARLRAAGALTLREEGAILALEGRSSLEEILSVTHTEDVVNAGSPSPGPVHRGAAA